MRAQPLVASLLVGAALGGCLPVDGRPEPGRMETFVQRSDTVIDGFVTDDGWTITFERFVTALGDVELEEDTCNDYTFTRYDRLFDFAAPDTPDEQKISLVYGLGECNVEFSVRAPRTTALLGHGVDEGDKELMRVEGTDPFASSERTTLLVRGRAEKDGVEKSFLWFFRHGFDLNNCRTPGDPETFVNTYQMESGSVDRLVLELRPEELFRATPSRDAPILFEPFAAADEDGDGGVSFDELAAVELDIAPIFEDLQNEIPEDLRDRFTPESIPDATLGRYLYDILVPRIAAPVGGSECEFQLRFWLSN